MQYVVLTWIDYALFVVMFGLSGIVGIYFGCCKKQNTTKDYLHGGKNMKSFPVAMSLVASTLSGVALLGVPAEVYMYGSQYSMLLISILLVGVVIKIVFLPVFYQLQVISIFEYLEMRFDKRMRVVASAMSTFVNWLSLPIIIYAPSLAFNHVTGVNIHLVALAMSLFCIFYTTIGGVKAVVWTDTLQFCVTLATLAVVLVVGTISVGGPSTIWKKASAGDRLEFFNMDPDPTLRNSFWAVVIGNFTAWVYYIGISQTTVQRFLAVPTYSNAKTTLIVFIIFTLITKWISCFSGLIIYAKYSDCDPLTAGYIMKPDQILPYYVLDVAAQIPGLSGLFLAGLFSTALSTLSSYLNSLAGTMYQDFILPFMPTNTSEIKSSLILKFLTFIIGVVSVCLIFVVEKLGSILQVLLSLYGICGGPSLGLFILGMLFPMANTKGAFWGVLISIVFMAVIVVENQYLVFTGAVRFASKPLHTFGCNVTSFLNETNYNQTIANSNFIMNITNSEPELPFWLFRISFYYYTFIGCVLTIVIGLIVSWATRSINDGLVKPSLISPCVRRFMSKSSMDTQYELVQKELQLIISTKRADQEVAIDSQLK